MHPLEATTGRFISSHTPVAAGSAIVVGLSGGADSVALLTILHNLGYDVTALHCNFHLRGAESDRDAAHARAVAEEAGVSLRSVDFDVEAWRREHGGSVEMACRELRYRWFEEQRRDLGAAAIAVAHHRDDNIETFMLNLLRGTSISGLCGMEPFDARSRVLRPLLHANRADIESYLADCGLTWVTDSTNAMNDYRRNRLRNVVIPAITGQFADAPERISHTMELLRANRDFYRRAIARAIAPCLGDDGTIDIATLRRDPDAPLILFEHLRHTGLTATQAADIVKSADASGLTFPTPQITYLLDRGTLRQLGGGRLPSRADIEISLAPSSALDPSQAPRRAYFSARLMERAADIKVRRWQPGDRLKPWGARGSKKLSDLFSDAGMAIDRKEEVPVVELDGEILWVAGVRASRLYPVEPEATEITVMTLLR